jgi:hypothetical protein
MTDVLTPLSNPAPRPDEIEPMPLSVFIPEKPDRPRPHRRWRLPRLRTGEPPHAPASRETTPR